MSNSQPGEDGSKPCSINQRGRLQASQRPPRAGHVEVDVGAVAGDDVAKVLLVSERQVVATILWNWVQAAPPIRRLCDLASAR
jgi:hypothetical protein